MTLSIIENVSSIINNVSSRIKDFYEIIKDMYNVFLSFLPSPIDYIFSAFLIFIAIILIAKFINILTEIIT